MSHKMFIQRRRTFRHDSLYCFLFSHLLFEPLIQRRLVESFQTFHFQEVEQMDNSLQTQSLQRPIVQEHETSNQCSRKWHRSCL